MINVKDIQSLTDFKRHTSQYVKQMKETGSPMVLTVNGKAELIVQDAEAYQELMERVEYAESVAALRQGIEDFEQGKFQPARQALEELRQKHGIPR